MQIKTRIRPCFTSLEAQQTCLFGQEDIPRRDAKRGKGWKQHVVPSFFLFLIGREPSELPSLFRLCDLAPQLKLDHETKYISVPFHVRLGAKDQHTVDGVLTKKDEADQGKLKDTQSCPKEYLIIWILACER